MVVRGADRADRLAHERLVGRREPEPGGRGRQAAQSRVEALVVRQERLQDPAYVTSLIRERLHYVLPGEVGYVVLDPSEAPAPSSAVKATAPVAWYSRLWTSVQTTDGAAADDDKTVIPVRTNAPR